ncbi:MAG: sugar ABC transporter permease [Anaerolineae bacterium]|nr:sugar ABC transporter permease [Anaerolineae bacterium]
MSTARSIHFTGALFGSRGSVRRREIKRQITGITFISPWIVGFVCFTIYPIAASLYYGFTRYDVVRPPRFIGLDNYQKILLDDRIFRIVLSNTLYFVVFGLPAAIVTAFLVANLLNTDVRGRSLYRTIFFIPSIVPAVSSAMVWLFIYNTEYGLISSMLSLMGLPAIPWLSSAALAKPSLIIIQCWAQGSAIVIFLAALQDVPRELYEAAVIDGASTPQRFRHITIPMCTPSIFFITITGLIGTFQSFTMPYLLTGGGPNNATELYAVYLYRNAFQYFKMGYASALAWILFIVVVFFSIITFRSSNRWVYYAGK